MHLFKNIIRMLVLFSFSHHTFACWNANEIAEIDGFSEMEGIFILSFKDAVNCKRISNATVHVNNKNYKTNAEGYVKFATTEFSHMEDEQLEMQLSKPGYITLNTVLYVEVFLLLNRRFAVSPVLDPEKFRFVLQWNERPNDLDLHLKGPNVHISYQHKKYIPNKARLDRDARHGFGPETITLYRANKNATYELWVDNYSGGHFNSGAHIDIYANNTLYKSIILGNSTKRANHVLSLKHGEITVYNKFENTSL